MDTNNCKSSARQSWPLEGFYNPAALSADNDGIDNGGHTKGHPRERLRVPRHAGRKESSSNRCCRVTDAFWPEFSRDRPGPSKGRAAGVEDKEKKTGEDSLYVLFLINMFGVLRNGRKTPGRTFCKRRQTDYSRFSNNSYKSFAEGIPAKK